MTTVTELATELERVPAVIPPRFKKTLEDEGSLAAQRMRFGMKQYPMAQFPSLNIRSGELITGIATRTWRGMGDAIVSETGQLSTDPKVQMYSRTQEYGAVISAKNPSGTMQIPVFGALKQDGTPRFRGTKDAAREYQLLWTKDRVFGTPLRGQFGNVARPGAPGEKQLLFVRRATVKIKSHAFARPQLAPMVRSVVDRAVREVLSALAGQ